MQNTLEKIYQVCGAYFLIKTLHALAYKVSLEMTGNLITRLMYGVLNRHGFSRHKPEFSIVKLNSQGKQKLGKSSCASAKLLRRDLRNNALLFKFMHLKKHDPF